MVVYGDVACMLGVVFGWCPKGLRRKRLTIGIIWKLIVNLRVGRDKGLRQLKGSLGREPAQTDEYYPMCQGWVGSIRRLVGGTRVMYPRWNSRFTTRARPAQVARS